MARSDIFHATNWRKEVFKFKSFIESVYIKKLFEELSVTNIKNCIKFVARKIFEAIIEVIINI